MRPLIVPLILAAAIALGCMLPSVVPVRETTNADRILAAIDPSLIEPLSQPRRRQLHLHAAQLASGQPRVGRCWAPGTDPAQIAAFLAAEEAARAIAPARGDGDPQRALQLDTRWWATATDGTGQGTQGLPITLTWSIVPDGTAIPGDPTIGDSSDPSDLRAFLSGIYGGSATGPPDQQPWFVHFQSIFDNIAAQTGLTYVYQPNDDGVAINAANSGSNTSPGTRGDIRIGGHDFAEPTGSAGTLAYNFFPNRGDMVIDTSDDWFEDHKNSPIHIGNLLEHEHGHGLGLNHVCPDDGTKLMEPFITTGFDGIQFDDIYSLQRHYGDFYEKHSSARDNDSAANAAPLSVVPGTPFATGWVSIDDNTDVDYYRFSTTAESTFTIRVVPSTESYLEGAQNPGCSSSTLFDSSALHNLGLTLLAPDQATVLATAPANPTGQTGEITAFTTTDSGFHYIKVDGDSADAAQLYRLEIDLTVPAVEIAVTNAPIVLESFAGNNGGVDPGETVQVDITLANNGTIDATNVQAVLAGPAAFSGFTATGAFGDLDSGQSNTRSFVFALEGSCGNTVNLNLMVTADDGYLVKLPLSFSLGVPANALDAPFHDAALPAGWTSGTSGVGGGWAPSTVQAASPTRSVFTPNPADVGESILTSPVVTLGAGTSTLSFANYYNTEDATNHAYDGGVLEISIDGGPWTDILAAGGLFDNGGYNRSINESFGNPLAGRAAWAGDSAGFITTAVTLPTAAASLPVRFRWILGSDESQEDVGWFIDDITLVTHTCDQSGIALAVTLDDASASEFTPLDTATLTLTARLPPLHPTLLSPLISGSANPSLDVTGLDSLMLAAGQTTLPVTIQAINDTLAEGDETLELTFPGSAGSHTVTITDTPYGQWAATWIGPGSANGPLDDYDHDQASNLAEYAHQTDPASSSTRPDLNPRLDGAFFRLDAPLATLPPDVQVGAESSQDLQIWSSTGIQTLSDGFQIPAGPADPTPVFLRLTYDLLPAAP